MDSSAPTTTTGPCVRAEIQTDKQQESHLSNTANITVRANAINHTNVLPGIKGNAAVWGRANVIH